MTYPTVESNKCKVKKEQDAMRKEAELYIDSDSFEEFELKRTIAGIKHRVIADFFKLHYLYSDKCMWLYDCHENLIPAFGITSVISIIISLILCLSSTGPLWLRISVSSFSGMLLLSFIALCWTYCMYDVAKDLINKVVKYRQDERQKNGYMQAHNNAGISGNIVIMPNSVLTSAYQCPSSYLTSYCHSSSNSLSC